MTIATGSVRIIIARFINFNSGLGLTIPIKERKNAGSIVNADTTAA